MASRSEQFLKDSWNSVQRSKRSSGLEIRGTDRQTNEQTDGHTPATPLTGGIKTKNKNPRNCHFYKNTTQNHKNTTQHFSCKIE